MSLHLERALFSLDEEARLDGTAPEGSSDLYGDAYVKSKGEDIWDKVGNSTASVTIKGKGNFSGSKTLKFSIRFRDVSTSYKFYSAIQMGANKGIVSGYAKNGKPTGYFGPNDNLKRCDVAIMFWKAAGSLVRENEALRRELDEVYSSIRYRVGTAVTAPGRLLRRFR